MSELNQDAERAAFEAWALKSGWEQSVIDIRSGDGYAEPFLTDYWGCWKDARRTAPVGEVELPALPTLPDFMRRDVERAIKEAAHPTGMSVHDGKARIGGDRLQRLLMIADAIAPYAARIRQLERELAERKTASIDTPEFWQLLSTHVNNCDSGPDKAVLESRAALIAHIDCRPAGAAWISVDDARKPNVGTPVLVYVRTLTNGEDDDGRPYAEEGAVIDIGEYKKASYDGEHYFACFMSPISDNDWITHWMPLPAEPIATKEA